jgi:hypothetical protein
MSKAQNRQAAWLLAYEYRQITKLACNQVYQEGASEDGEIGVLGVAKWPPRRHHRIASKHQ